MYKSIKSHFTKTCQHLNHLHLKNVIQHFLSENRVGREGYICCILHGLENKRRILRLHLMESSNWFEIGDAFGLQMKPSKDAASELGYSLCLY